MLDTVKLDPPQRTSRRKPLIEPIPPLKYDGSADLRAFNGFIYEGTLFVVDCEVEKERQVVTLIGYAATHPEGPHLPIFVEEWGTTL